MLITFTGCSSAGKSTQIRNLQKLGWRAICSYEENAFEALYEQSKNEEWKPKSILGPGGDLLRCVGMLFNYHNKVRPAVELGENIVFDYYFIRLLPHSIVSLESFLRYFEVYPFKPDERHIYLKVDCEALINRHEDRYKIKADSNIKAGISKYVDWFNAVADAGYLVTIDGTLPPDQITEQILEGI